MKYAINETMVADILAQMPESKKEVFRRACDRNFLMTSYYGLEECELTVYKEGWLVELRGCRAKFSVWAGDNDGEFVFGRKPNESKLHKLYTDSCKADTVIDFHDI